MLTELVDTINSVPVIYADDLGAIEIVGSRARLTFIEYQRQGLVLIKCPVVHVIRPVDTINTDNWFRMLTEAMHEAVKAPLRALGRH